MGSICIPAVDVRPGMPMVRVGDVIDEDSALSEPAATNGCVQIGGPVVLAGEVREGWAGSGDGRTERGKRAPFTVRGETVTE